MRLYPSKKTSVFLRDVANIVMGQSPAGSSYNPNEGIEFHQGKSYFGEVLLDRSPVKTTQPTKFAQDGDIVICVRAPVGIVNITDRKICIGRGLASISAKDSIDQRFLFYLIQSKKKVIEILASGSTFSCISGPQLSELILDIPSKDKQSVISKALYSLEKHIYNLEQLIRKQEAIKKTTQFLLLQPKDNWNRITLGDICDITGAGVDKKINPNEERCVLLNYLDVYHKTYIYSSDLHHVVSATKKQKLKCSVKKNDIFFTPSSETPDDIARSCVAMEDMQDVAYSYHIVRARPKIECNSLFIKYMCSTNDFLLQAQTACVGSGKRYVISLPKFREFVICMPDIEEQNKIATQLSEIDAHIENLKQQLAKQRAIKQGLMDYFFGN